MFNDSCLSQDEMELRDMKFLEGRFDNADIEPQEVYPPSMDATLVGDWQCGLTAREVAFKNNVTEVTVRRAIDDYMTTSAVFDNDDC